jgi:hypothetical protein
MTIPWQILLARSTVGWITQAIGGLRRNTTVDREREKASISFWRDNQEHYRSFNNFETIYVLVIAKENSYSIHETGRQILLYRYPPVCKVLVLTKGDHVSQYWLTRNFAIFVTPLVSVPLIFTEKFCNSMNFNATLPPCSESTYVGQGIKTETRTGKWSFSGSEILFQRRKENCDRSQHFTGTQYFYNSRETNCEKISFSFQKRAVFSHSSTSLL